MKAKIERSRVDVDITTKLIIDDLIERGYFKDQQSVLIAAISALQLQLASETLTDEYYDDTIQRRMDEQQLELGAL